MDSANITQPQLELPCNIFAERVVLGNLIEDAAPLSAILAIGLSVGDFMLSDHRRIFQAVLDLRQVNAPIDYVSIAEHLGNSAHDFALLGDLIHGVVVETSHALYHAKKIKEKAQKREVLKIGEWLEAAAADTDPELLVHLAIEKLQGVRL